MAPPGAEDGMQRTELAAGNEPFIEPFDVDVDRHGTLYVLDSGAGRVSQYDSTLAFVRELAIDPAYVKRARGIAVGGEASGSGRLPPAGMLALVQTSLENTVWLADTSGGMVAEFDVSGTMLRSYNVRNDLVGAGEAQPVDVLQLGDGTVWSTDAGVHKLTLYSADGMRLRSSDISAANTRDGSHLAAGHVGDVFMTEPERRTIARFGADGTRIATYTIDGVGGAPVKPMGIDVDEQGNVWISDAEGGRALRLEIEANH